MVDFRKWFPALAVVALAFGAASTANAAGPRIDVFSIQGPNAASAAAAVEAMLNTVPSASEPATAFISDGAINFLNTTANVGGAALRSPDLHGVAITGNAINKNDGKNEGTTHQALAHHGSAIDPHGTNATVIIPATDNRANVITMSKHTANGHVAPATGTVGGGGYAVTVNEVLVSGNKGPSYNGSVKNEMSIADTGPQIVFNTNSAVNNNLGNSASFGFANGNNHLGAFVLTRVTGNNGAAKVYHNTALITASFAPA